MNFIDAFLNRITMYRLVLYCLIAFIAIAVALCSLRILPYDPVMLVLSTLFLVAACDFFNWIFAKVWNVPTNIESAAITGLILALLIAPPAAVSGYIFLTWAALLAMASKYILNLNKKHLFNPAAIAVVLTAFGFGQAAIWWVGTASMAIPVLIGGLLIIRKTKKENMIFAFLTAVIVSAGIFTVLRGGSLTDTIPQIIMHSPFLFFAGVMLTEPLTMPSRTTMQILFAVLIGFLFDPRIHIGPLYSTPELALVAGNCFAYLVSPKIKLVLTQGKKIKLSEDTYDFVFPLEKKLAFLPGQYMEWTLPHAHSDSRGNRRYFTIASSPTEQTLRLGIKIGSPASTYKKTLLTLTTNDSIVGAGLSGDFTLPKNSSQPLVFMAGGIGITPFRSMIQYCIDRNEKQPITVFYSNKTADEIVYKDVLKQAEALGIRTIYTLTDQSSLPQNWTGEKGRVDEIMIEKYVPDYRNALFYISGPRTMVTSCETLLKRMGIAGKKIKTDFFPGFV